MGTWSIRFRVALNSRPVDIHCRGIWGRKVTPPPPVTCRTRVRLFRQVPNNTLYLVYRFTLHVYTNLGAAETRSHLSPVRIVSNLTVGGVDAEAGDLNTLSWGKQKPNDGSPEVGAGVSRPPPETAVGVAVAGGAGVIGAGELSAEGRVGNVPSTGAGLSTGVVSSTGVVGLSGGVVGLSAVLSTGVVGLSTGVVGLSAGIAVVGVGVGPPHMSKTRLFVETEND